MRRLDADKLLTLSFFTPSKLPLQRLLRYCDILIFRMTQDYG
jgi:hypothetical protein